MYSIAEECTKNVNFFCYLSSSNITVANQDVLEPTKIINLNEDCLYETLIHLDVEDLFSMAETSSRFTPIAQHIVEKK